MIVDLSKEPFKTYLDEIDLDSKSDDIDWFKDEDALKKYTKSYKKDFYETKCKLEKFLYEMYKNNNDKFSFKFVDPEYYDIMVKYIKKLLFYRCDLVLKFYKKINNKNILIIENDDTQNLTNILLNIFVPETINVIHISK